MKKYPIISPPERVPPVLRDGTGYMVTVQHKKNETDYFTFTTLKRAQEFFKAVELKYA